MGFIGAHGEEVTHKILDPFVAKLKEDGITSFAALGYCFGARYVFNLSFANSITVGVVNHPSLLRVPDDLNTLSQLSPAVPMLFNTCEVDQMYPAEAQAKGDEILGNGSKEGKAYKRNYYDGCTHGFAVRGDIKDEKVKFGKEDSFKQSVEW
jgi:dienelactone hydrolase